jgi:mannose/fructose/N-acetylgalactosamine-specific phosphotransferase system component IIB
MADVSLIRVDNRLIHGQVATGFMNQCSAAKIVVIDDRTASSELAKDALELATPAGIELSVLTAVNSGTDSGSMGIDQIRTKKSGYGYLQNNSGCF